MRPHGAAQKCHEVVCQFAPHTRRLRELRESGMSGTLELQLEVYIAGSMSFKVVEESCASGVVVLLGHRGLDLGASFVE